MRIATRGSALARWQAEHVADRLRARDAGVTVQLVIVQTEGDRRRDQPIHTLGGQGVFVKEVQAAVLDGRADVAVHSAKDLPSITAPGLALAAVPERGDPRDALAGRALADLAPGAPLATGSVRRRAQLAQLRPDLTYIDLRGNVPSRLEKIPPGGAIAVAAAALARLGVPERAAEILDVDTMVPQIAQGALALECRADDDATMALVAALEDPATRLTVDAERAFLAHLGGGCELPVGAHATLEGDAVVLRSFLAGDDARVWQDVRRGGADDASRWAATTAAEALAAVS